ncbi:MAG: DNA repair protein RadC [Neomegalonema sp.]|nr:DNA repair protein RadC [Neomegalonema sp.]
MAGAKGRKKGAAAKRESLTGAQEAANLFGDALPQEPAPKSASSEPNAAPIDHRHGHRDRLRTRFRQGGADAVAEYELLELILFRAIPRRDVKPLAKKLIERFGSMAAALSASPDQLREIGGLGEAAICEFKIIEAAAHSLVRTQILDRTEISSSRALVDYCRAAMAHQPVEQFRLLFLDKQNRLIADEVQSEGTIDQVQVFPREVVRRAIALNATAIIMVHNHPSGDPTPSRADIAMTEQVKAALTTIGVVLHEHLIIGKAGEVSFKGLGYL